MKETGRRASVVAGAALLVITGCGKSPPPNDRTSVESSMVVMPPGRTDSRAEPAAEPPPIPLEAVLPTAIAQNVETPPASTAVLEERYALPSSGAEMRGEIIRELGTLDTPEAISVLSRIFSREKREELRLEIIRVVGESDDDKVRERKFSFFAATLSPKLPRLTRIVAISSLSEFKDSRVIPLLRTLQSDADSEIRAFVAETLRDLEE